MTWELVLIKKTNKCFHKLSCQDDHSGSLPAQDILWLHVSQILWYFNKHHQEHKLCEIFPTRSRKDGALPEERISDQHETLILHGQDLLVVELPDTSNSVYHCNDQGARIVCTPFFLFGPKSFMDNAETGPDLGEQVKKSEKNHNTNHSVVLQFYVFS